MCLEGALMSFNCFCRAQVFLSLFCRRPSLILNTLRNSLRWLASWQACNGGGILFMLGNQTDWWCSHWQSWASLFGDSAFKSCLVVCRYMPPNDPVGSFSKLERVLSYLDKEDKEIVLLGDKNCDLTTSTPDHPAGNNANHICNICELFSLK